ncbi:MAG: ferredoxin family protein [Candidatus Odinarchaeota archaeon]
MVTINRDKCVRCGICIEVCPRAVYGTDVEGYAILVNQNDCIECGACELNCKGYAIDVKAEGCGCLGFILKKRIRKLLGLKEPKSCCNITS